MSIGWIIVLSIIGLGVIAAVIEKVVVPWWLKNRPRVLTPPDYWPNGRVYQRNVKFIESLAWFPARFGTGGGMVILNMPFGPFAPFIPFTMLLAAFLSLFLVVPYHWIWYRLGGK